MVYSNKGFRDSAIITWKGRGTGKWVSHTLPLIKQKLISTSPSHNDNIKATPPPPLEKKSPSIDPLIPSLLFRNFCLIDLLSFLKLNLIILRFIYHTLNLDCY